jgi:hypothetical protein
MTRELLDIASNHADGKEAVAATLNTPQGKGKQVVDHGEGTSSCFKKKKKNDKRRRDDNFVAAVGRKASRTKGNPAKPAPSSSPGRSGYPKSSGRVFRVSKSSGNKIRYPIGASKNVYPKVRVPAKSGSGSGIPDLPENYKITAIAQTSQNFL